MAFELRPLLVIGADCTDSSKANYHIRHDITEILLKVALNTKEN
jgi:hypothetical protein